MKISFKIQLDSPYKSGTINSFVFDVENVYFSKSLFYMHLERGLLLWNNLITKYFNDFKCNISFISKVIKYSNYLTNYIIKQSHSRVCYVDCQL